MDALERARRDAAEGRAWKARDRLTGLLAHRPDATVADELAQIHHLMHDLPAAGALWFVTGRDDEIARESVAAWREQHGDAAAQWRTIPGPLREAFASEPHLAQLRAESRRSERASLQRYRQKVRAAQPRDRTDRVLEVVGTLILSVVLLSLVTALGVGVWTIGHWIVS